VQQLPRLKVTEIYASVQGESTHAGRLCAFVRLTGCNLRCTWCDSEYTFSGGDWMSIEQIISKVDELEIPLVQVTGGEPLAQKECMTLMQTLLDEGYEVLLETSGSISVAEVPLSVSTIMDLKAPSSGESAKNLWSNIELLGEGDEVKIVIGSRQDYDWALEVMSKHNANYLLSPVWGVLDPKDLAEWMLQDKVLARMQVQLHKVLWPNKTSGI
tara:strand:- start:409 stop:1050 length:642 start_codon:yes stop_codon:yes gene_type:complete